MSSYAGEVQFIEEIVIKVELPECVKKTKSITSLTTPGKERIHKSGKKWNKHDQAIQCCFTALFTEEFNSTTVLHFPKYFSKSLLERNDIGQH